MPAKTAMVLGLLSNTAAGNLPQLLPNGPPTS
jgi:hypothetical protein